MVDRINVYIATLAEPDQKVTSLTGSPEESFEDSSTSMEPSEAESNDKRRYKTKGDPNSEPVAPDQAYNKLCMFLTESKQLRQCEEESRAESTEDDAVVESLQGQVFDCKNHKS
jgi:hypothetical protein